MDCKVNFPEFWITQWDPSAAQLTKNALKLPAKGAIRTAGINNEIPGFSLADWIILNWFQLEISLSILPPKSGQAGWGTGSLFPDLSEFTSAGSVTWRIVIYFRALQSISFWNVQDLNWKATLFAAGQKWLRT